MKLLRALAASLVIPLVAMAWTACSSSSNGATERDASAQDVAADQSQVQTSDAGADVADGGSSSFDSSNDAAEAGIPVYAPVNSGVPSCVVDAGATYLTDAVEISIGADIACAVRQNGTVVCWGGEVGMVLSQFAFPADAGDLRAQHVTVSARTACVLDTQGSVWCLGSNFEGQLGNGTPSDLNGHTVPTRVVDAEDHPISAVQIGGGYDFTCALTAQGTVLCWGADNILQLGQDAGTSTEAGVPYSSVALPVSGVTFEGGFLFNSSLGEYTCAAGPGGIACWGDNSAAECMQDVSKTGFNLAVAPGLTDAGATLPIRTLALGQEHACVLDDVQQVYCWGANDYFDRGTDAATGTAPNLVMSLADAGVSGIACGRSLTCAVDSMNHVRCFGSTAGFGELGNGQPGNSTVSTSSVVVDVDGGGALSPVARVYSGGSNTCAILVGPCGPNGPGQVFCWGYGPDNGGTSMASSGIPVPVLFP